jgi:hypothetical protein
LLANLNFHKAFDWHAYKITNRNVDLAAMERFVDRILQGQNVVLRNLIPGEMERRAKEVFQLFNQAWNPIWGHVPLTWSQFRYLMENVKPLIRPQLAHLVLDHDRMVGFGLALPDLNPLVKKLNGRLTLWGKLRLLYAAKYGPIRKIRAMVVGIGQQYQLRKLHQAMILRSYIYLVKHTQCQMADLSLIPENLHHWIKVLLAFGAQRYKVFRVFEREI